MNLIAFFAHPDDETMLAGGTLALLAEAGFSIHYLCATRGEGGEIGEPPVCTPQELGQVREQEMVCAVQELAGRSLTFLGYVDPSVGEGDELFAYTEDLTLLAGQVAASIRQLAPLAVITHGSNGEYGHPAHLLTHQAGRIAVESFGASAPLLYTVSAAFPGHPRPRLANRDDTAHLVLDTTPVLRRKENAAMCHRSQHALFVRRASQEAGRHLSVAEVILPLESVHRAYPAFEGNPDDPVARELSRWRAKA